MSTDQQAPFLFIIDTTDYAGNFEREMCAYITGRIGECGVGDNMAELYLKETGQEAFENVIDEPDEHGCHRPVSIYDTPGYFNNGLGGHYKDTPANEERALKAYRKEAASYAADHAKAPRRHLAIIEKGTDTKQIADLAKVGWTKAGCLKAIQGYEREIAEAEATTKVTKYPSYQSVSISFESEPTAAQITLMKERAALFAKLPDRWNAERPRVSRILGFRLIQQMKRKVKARAV